MWLTYAAYLMLRAGIEDPERRKRFASVYSIIAFTSVLLTVIIIRVRPDTIHPSFGPTVTEPDASGNFEMSAKIAQTLIFNIITFSIIAVVVAWHRIRLENRKQEIEARKMRLLMDS
jgi:heme exporter protein C